MTVAVRTSSNPVGRRSRTKKPPEAVPVEALEVEVVVRDPALDAHRLRVAGLGWAEIAQRVGYASAGVAQMAVSAMLQKTAVETGTQQRAAALQTELERLDGLHAAFWPKAIAGDVQAAAVVLKTSDRRSRLLGLDGALGELASQLRTIVIGGGADMAEQLRAAALGLEK